jgi:hypothetical protein
VLTAIRRDMVKEDIRDKYRESARVAMNLKFWEHMALEVYKCTPEEAKEYAILLNKGWEEEHG